jgi:glycosidase
MNRNNLIDSLRIYQIMIAPYRNGNPSNGFGIGYGPSHHKGDLSGIMQALDSISELGFNALLLSPVFDTRSETKLASTAYYPANYFDIDPHFGNKGDFRALVSAAHERGMALFLDCPFGHVNTGSEPSPDLRHLLPSSALVPDPFGMEYPGADFSDPANLAFAAEIATYWINEFGIDGWRADQAYQMVNNGRNVWDFVVSAVRRTCEARASRGERWGTLGFMVGEVWRDEFDIAKYGYGAEGFLGLDSCYDFPWRYRLLQVLATEEVPESHGRKNYGQGVQMLRNALDIRAMFPSHAHPTAMIGTHDLARLGNLITRCPLLRYGREHGDYWKRHELAIAFLAASSGPMLLYYGEEIGDIAEGYINPGDLGMDDFCASRTPGRFAGSDPRYASQERVLWTFTKNLMRLRAQHPALYRGSRRNLIANGTIFVEEKTAGTERMIFAMNLGTEAAIFRIEESFNLVDAISGELVRGDKSATLIPMNPLNARFLSIV